MPDPTRDTDAKDDSGRDTRTPRWVKACGIIALVVILAFVIVLVTRGPHRPGMHGAGGGAAPSASVTAPGSGGGHTPSDRSH
ncbi:MAG: hypothetical protein ACRDRX_17545 [Pseudonocardiaceae bacterium]